MVQFHIIHNPYSSSTLPVLLVNYYQYVTSLQFYI